MKDNSLIFQLATMDQTTGEVTVGDEVVLKNHNNFGFFDIDK